MRKRVISFTFVLLLAAASACAKVVIKDGSAFTQAPISELKKTVVFLGKIAEDGKPRIYATGFLVNVYNTYALITAKHVIISRTTGKMDDEDLLAFFNLRRGGVSVRSVSDLKRDYGIEWTFHPDPDVDVAVIPFMINPAEDDVMVIPENLFLAAENLYELYEVFFLSYQPGIEPKGKIRPITRSGTISVVNDDGTFYVDAFAFPGNTGSPVFLAPSPVRFDEKGFTIGSDPVGGRFVGMIGEYLTYQELAVSAATARPRVIFEENTGLSKVWSAGYIKETIESPVFKEQLKKVSGK